MTSLSEFPYLCHGIATLAFDIVFQQISLGQNPSPSAHWLRDLRASDLTPRALVSSSKIV